MALPFNNRLLYFLFLPGLVGVVLLEVSLAGSDGTRILLKAANILILLNTVLLLSLQAYYVWKFSEVTNSRRGFLRFNALFPAAFFLLYFLYVLYLAVRPNDQQSIQQPRPIKMAQLGAVGVLLIVLINYAAFNFFFLNNWLVKKKIRKIKDETKQRELLVNYLIPMKRLVRVSVLVSLVLLLLAVFADLLNFPWLTR